MRTRIQYLPISEAAEGMVLAAPVKVINHGFLRFSLPSGHRLTDDNLHQLQAHHAEFVFIEAPDPRPAEQVAVDAAAAAHFVLQVFRNADLTDPYMAAFFDQVLAYRST
ncbi:MAG: hypothetical protein NTX56_00070 [Proteobacteria bacterium]|nr:hypothetical protein [Pseudomonadota bacterium]